MKTIKMVANELDVTNQTIVNTLNKLLENQQILALESNRKIQRLKSNLEEEKQLNYSINIDSDNQKSFGVDYLVIKHKIKRCIKVL